MLKYIYIILLAFVLAIIVTNPIEVKINTHELQNSAQGNQQLVPPFPSKLTQIDTFNAIYQFNEGIGLTNYNDLIRYLENAPRGSKLTLNIDSPGGLVSTTMRVVEAMSSSNAIISCNVGNLAASGAAVTMLQCDKIKFQDNSLVLFHIPYYVVGNVAVHNPFTTEEFMNFLNKNYCFRDMLNATLYEKMIMGHDIVIKKDVITEMLKASCRMKKGYLIVGMS
jgi:membrane-bound ClpP family serine protease